MNNGNEPLLVVDGLSKSFGGRRTSFRRTAAEVQAVRGVSFVLLRGQSLGIVGESGSGKTTLARILVGLERPTEGRVVLRGEPFSAWPKREERRKRSRVIQIVFQDPYTSLDPRQSVRSALDEIQRVVFDRGRNVRRTRTRDLLEQVGLGEKEAGALPRELSGGQRQRAAIARSLAAEPEILILDEAVSALDVSIQAQILNLLADLRDQLHLAYVVISHDLAVVRQIADDVLVMYRGRVVETGPVDRILASPRHPYTRLLLESVPRAGMVLRRQLALLAEHDDGCLFRDRCDFAHDHCSTEPDLIQIDGGHVARCCLVLHDATATSARREAIE